MKGKPLKFGKGIHHEIQKPQVAMMDGSLTKEMLEKYLEEFYGEVRKKDNIYTGPVKEHPGWFQIETDRMKLWCGQEGWDMFQEALRKEAERLTLQNDKL